MTGTAIQVEQPDLLGWWIGANGPGRRTRIPRQRTTASGLLGFAFYGRDSTEDFQDRLSSSRWQRDFAQELIDGRGAITAEFFDVGVSRRTPWHLRPQAGLLLAVLAQPDRGFDAIVVGEFERAFYAGQYEQLAPLFAAHRVQLWLPELDGPVQPANELHMSLLALLGVHSRREVQRAQFRAKAAMRAQVEAQGRHLGGRPPYGYALVEAGPHPNTAHARWGRQLLRLEPDPVTAPVVRWIFDQRLAGYSISSITRELNEHGVPCPSAVDPERNPHRVGTAWRPTTVAAILANPRYTGRQVWNRQHHEYTDPVADDILGQSQIRRWNALQDCVVSADSAHPAIVSEEEFIAAQGVYAKPDQSRPERVYLLTGLIFCQDCGRRLEAHWTHGRAGYRCRHGHTATRQRGDAGPRTVYAREEQLLLLLAEQVPELRPPAGQGDRVRELIPEYLAGHEVAVRCGFYTWRLEVDGDLIFDGWPPRLARVDNGRRRRPRKAQDAAR
ncbi:recombinase family protein [Hamadaea sp. NPDC050747]|uniref:recombinase family protein n=1 Tax=Hamadaea sp. NPDC050747 TaxID=3155789 RepID=UPI003402B1B8